MINNNKHLHKVSFVCLLTVLSACSSSTDPALTPTDTVPPTTTAPPVNAFTFSEISTIAGIIRTGPSFGAGSWGDVNGDGLPDLWIGNHANKPNLYVNNGDGTFTDAINQYWAGLPTADTHGAVWTDLNKDGTLDLIELVGAQSGAGAGSNHAFMNIAGSFVDQAQSKGLDYPLGRGRTPLPVDFNHDAATDFVFAGFYSVSGATELFMQDPYTLLFNPQSTLQGLTLATQSNKSTQLADLNNDNQLDLVVNSSNFPYRVFDASTLPMTAITRSLNIPKSIEVQDVVFADFNNDLYTDVYVASYAERKISEVTQFTSNSIRLRLTNNSTQTKQFNFSAASAISLNLGVLANTSIFIGTTAINPTTSSFTLNPSDPNNQGVATLTTPGIYIGYNHIAQTWDMIAFQTPVNATITSTTALQLISTSGLANPIINPSRLFFNNNGNFVEQSIPNTFGRSAVAGDFDNDMDIDLYIVQSGTATNTPNVLLLNDGNGVFQTVTNAAGASGSTLGIGDSVSVVDYDNDGYLDLFVSNGEGVKVLGQTGPQQLFHNQGGTNHWLEIDLKGTSSQIEGVGAIVYVTAGGITQKREQNAGIHKNTQNHARLHFGLAQNTTIDTIKVLWPSGKISILNNVGADQIMRIQE